MHQDAHVFVSRLHPGVEVAHELAAGRGVYLYVIEGDADVVGERMTTGDAAEIWDVPSIAIRAERDRRSSSWSTSRSLEH